MATVDLASQRTGYNGFEAEFNQNVTRNIGIVTSFSGTFKNNEGYLTTTPAKPTGPTFSVTICWRVALQLARGGRDPVRARGSSASRITRASFDDKTRSDTAFAMAFGGGLDVHAGEHLDVRVIQVDYLPTFYNGKRQDNIRASAGIKIK